MGEYHSKHRHHRHHRFSWMRHPVGKVIVGVQLVFSVVFLVTFRKLKIFPVKYVGFVAAVLLVIFGVMLWMQFLHGKKRKAGTVLSVLVSLMLLVGLNYLNKADQLMSDVGGATFKTDNMVVVVRAENQAESLLDAANSRFGYQLAVDRENTDRMLDKMQELIGRDLNLVEYDTVVDVAQALLEGRVEAAIYNEAFTGIIEEYIEDYSDQVRVLYQYGIETRIEQEETDVAEPFHVYISGIDVSGPISTNSRSDVNILMTVNPKTKKILLTTTPRDFYVPIPGVSGDARDKLTHAGIYGVDASMSTLEQLYGIDISYYAKVNFTSLITIVDALGGVDVDSHVAFSAGGYDFVEGINHLNGEQALAFSRERHSFADGDNQRGRNQQAVLTAILQKAMSPAILTSASEILESVGGCVETNMTQDEMAEFINMQLEDPATWDIETVAASGSGDYQPCYSSGSQPLYVMWPDEAIVGGISRQMQNLMSEEKE